MANNVIVVQTGPSHLRDIFHRMGLSDKDIVALSGAHTLVSFFFLHQICECHCVNKALEFQFILDNLLKALISWCCRAEHTKIGLGLKVHGHQILSSLTTPTLSEHFISQLC